MDSVAYHGEVWTDGSGFATVRLPDEAGPLEPPLEYELRDLEPPGSARVTAELEDGRFTIATDQPPRQGWLADHGPSASGPDTTGGGMTSGRALASTGNGTEEHDGQVPQPTLVPPQRQRRNR